MLTNLKTRHTPLSRYIAKYGKLIWGEVDSGAHAFRFNYECRFQFLQVTVDKTGDGLLRHGVYNLFISVDNL